jgi:hypothetical protein
MTSQLSVFYVLFRFKLVLYAEVNVFFEVMLHTSPFAHGIYITSADDVQEEFFLNSFISNQNYSDSISQFADFIYDMKRLIH